MSNFKDLEDLLKEKEISLELDTISPLLPKNNKTSVGIIVERCLIQTISNMNYFDSNYTIPEQFKESITGGLNFIGEKGRTLFEIDDYKKLDQKDIYIEVKSGSIHEKYLDIRYNSNCQYKKHHNSKIDINRIFYISKKSNINPTLIVFYNNESKNNKELMKKVKEKFKEKLFFIPFKFNYNYFKEFVNDYNSEIKKELSKKYSEFSYLFP